MLHCLAMASMYTLAEVIEHHLCQHWRELVALEHTVTAVVAAAVVQLLTAYCACIADP